MSYCCIKEWRPKKKNKIFDINEQTQYTTCERKKKRTWEKEERYKKIRQIFFIYRIRESMWDFKSTEYKPQHDVVDLPYKMI
jgi:hypothetical protein